MRKYLARIAATTCLGVAPLFSQFAVKVTANYTSALEDLQQGRWTEAQAKKFYAEHKERPFFGSLVSFMTSGPVLLMVLESENAVEKYRKLMGATNPANAAPGTIRKAFGESLEANSVHGSDSAASAAREIKYFFASEV